MTALSIPLWFYLTFLAAVILIVISANFLIVRLIRADFQESRRRRTKSAFSVADSSAQGKK